ncbi:MAG: hypothetical protein N4A50_12235 [Vallitalea sp.]|nr:hypothetical protein [Vallitalea sp.]
MTNLQGTYKTTKKNGTIYYRASITYLSKHISLGSYNTETQAHHAYIEANKILYDRTFTIGNYTNQSNISFEKWVVLINYRDSGHYIKNPIYLHKYYFSYFLSFDIELKFDVDDLFYYSNHKIFKKNGYMFVNDYGMQINILTRYGIKNHAVNGKDYYYKDGDNYNLRYHNIVILNKYYGVEKSYNNNIETFISKIHINGYNKIGTYATEIEAAIAYNKAVDFVIENNISTKNYTKNFISELTTGAQYKQIYENIKLSSNIISLTT